MKILGEAELYLCSYGNAINHIQLTVQYDSFGVAHVPISNAFPMLCK